MRFGVEERLVPEAMLFLKRRLWTTPKSARYGSLEKVMNLLERRVFSVTALGTRVPRTVETVAIGSENGSNQYPIRTIVQCSLRGLMAMVGPGGVLPRCSVTPERGFKSRGRVIVVITVKPRKVTVL